MKVASYSTISATVSVWLKVQVYQRFCCACGRDAIQMLAGLLFWRTHLVLFLCFQAMLIL